MAITRETETVRESATWQRLWLSSLRTSLTIALVIEALVVIGNVFGGWALVGALISAASGPDHPSGVGAYFAYGAIGLPAAIVLLAIPLGILVMIRTSKLIGPASRGDIGALKKLSSVGWAIIALIFSAIIPGILLLAADGQISSLEQGATQ